MSGDSCLIILYFGHCRMRIIWRHVFCVGGRVLMDKDDVDMLLLLLTMMVLVMIMIRIRTYSNVHNSPI